LQTSNDKGGGISGGKAAWKKGRKGRGKKGRGNPQGVSAAEGSKMAGEPSSLKKKEYKEKL